MFEPHEFNKNILRAYDIRGIFKETLNTIDAERLGNIFASSFNSGSKKIVVCRDGRLSSPDLVKSLKKGLLESGADVIDIGLGPSPMLYYAANHLKSDGAIMVTGSHNPSNHNGFKIMKANRHYYCCQIKGHIGFNEACQYYSATKESERYVSQLLLSNKSQNKDDGKG